MDYTALVIAIAGLVTTAAAPLIQGRMTSANHLRDWHRDRRVEVYAEVLGAMEAALTFADSTQDPNFSRRADHEPAYGKDEVTARLTLVGDRTVLTAWREFVRAHHAFGTMLNEEYPSLGMDWETSVPDDDSQLVEIRRAADVLRAAVVGDFGTHVGSRSSSRRMLSAFKRSPEKRA